MKKFLATLMIAPLLLTACGGGNKTLTEEDAPYFYTYKTAEFSIAVPDTWETQTAFTSEYPDEVRAAFKNNIRESDFVANVTVIREENSKNYSNFDFSQTKLSSHADSLLNYQLVSQEELTLEVGNSTSISYLNTFLGKNSTSSPTLSFMQVYLTKGDRAWTATATYMPSEDDFVVDRMETMLKSFSLN